MNDGQHLARIFRCPEDYRQIQATVGYWPADAATALRRSKIALESLRQRQSVQATNAKRGKLAETMFARECQDLAFPQLRDQFRAWFPEVRQ